MKSIEIILKVAENSSIVSLKDTASVSLHMHRTSDHEGGELVVTYADGHSESTSVDSVVSILFIADEPVVPEVLVAPEPVIEAPVEPEAVVEAPVIIDTEVSA